MHLFVGLGTKGLISELEQNDYGIRFEIQLKLKKIYYWFKLSKII